MGIQWVWIVQEMEAQVKPIRCQHHSREHLKKKQAWKELHQAASLQQLRWLHGGGGVVEILLRHEVLQIPGATHVLV